MKNRIYSSATSLACLLIAGCGGGGGGSAAGDSSGGGISQDFGAVSIRSLTAAKQPVVMGSRNAVFTGVFGATFNEIIVRNPPPNNLTEAEVLAQTYIAYNQNGDPRVYNFGTGAISTIGVGQFYGNGSTPSISGRGDRLVYCRVIDNAIQLVTSNLDGSNQKVVTSGNQWSLRPAYSKNGTKIAFTRQNVIHVVPAGGGTATPITSAVDTAFPLTWTHDGRILIWRKIEGQTLYKLYSIKDDGTDIKLIASSFSSDSTHCSLSVSSDNENYVQGFFNGNYVLATGQLSVGASGTNIAEGVFGVSFAPVGPKFVYAKAGASAGLYLRDSQTNQETLLVAGSNISDPSWGPYITSRSVVGSGGTLGTSTGGFLFGQVGLKVAGFVSFDATTRSTLEVIPQGSPNPGQANTVCTVTGDSLRVLKYFNDMRGEVVSAVTPSNPVSGAIVSFDADTGRVATVVPYKTASVTRSTERLVYNGELTGVWDEKGENRAPNGATEIELDPNTGKVLSFR